VDYAFQQRVKCPSTSRNETADQELKSCWLFFLTFAELSITNKLFNGILHDKNVRVKSKKYSDLYFFCDCVFFISCTSFYDSLRCTPFICLSLDKYCCTVNLYQVRSAATFTLHILQNNTNPSVEKILWLTLIVRAIDSQSDILLLAFLINNNLLNDNKTRTAQYSRFYY